MFLKSKFEDLGIKVIVLNMNSNFIIGFYKLIKTYISFKPILIKAGLSLRFYCYNIINNNEIKILFGQLDVLNSIKNLYQLKISILLNC